MTYASVAASADVDVYANWAEIMVRMTYGSVKAKAIIRTLFRRCGKLSIGRKI